MAAADSPVHCRHGGIPSVSAAEDIPQLAAGDAQLWIIDFHGGQQVFLQLLCPVVLPVVLDRWYHEAPGRLFLNSEDYHALGNRSDLYRLYIPSRTDFRIRLQSFFDIFVSLQP